MLLKFLPFSLLPAGGAGIWGREWLSLSSVLSADPPQGRQKESGVVRKLGSCPWLVGGEAWAGESDVQKRQLQWFLPGSWSRGCNQGWLSREESIILGKGGRPRTGKHHHT